MADLLVSPAILESLAKNQADAAKDAQEAADALSGAGMDTWLNHGVISGCSNSAFVTIEGIRQTAGSELADASTGLAAKLRTAKQAYEGVDGELAGGLSKQMLDK
jgi:ESX secretion-associated protein EspC/F